MKYLLFFILFSSASFAFDLTNPFDFKNTVLVQNAGKTLGKMDLYLDDQKCALNIDLASNTVSYFSYGHLGSPFKTVEFKDFISNPISKSLIWSKTWPLPLMHDRLIIYFNDQNKLSKVVTYQYSSWKPSTTYTCLF